MIVCKKSIKGSLIKPVFFIFIFFIASTLAETLSIKEAWYYAKEHHPKIKAASYGIDIAQSNVDESWSSYRPNLSINTAFFKISEETAEMTMGMMPEYQGWVAATASQQIFKLDSNTKIDTAKIQKTIAKLNKNSTKMDIALSIGADYIAIGYYTVIKKTYEAKKERISGYLGIAQQRYDAGVTDIADLYRWKSEIKKIEALLKMAQDSIDTQKATLKKNIGMPQSTMLEITINMKEIEAFANLQDSDTTARKNPYVEMKKKQNEQFDIERDNLLYSYFTPEASLIGGVAQSVLREGAGKDMSPMLNHGTIWTQYVLAVTASVPIYTGGMKGARRETLRIQQLQNRSEIADVEEELQKEQIKAQKSIDASQKSYTLNKEAAIDAFKYLDIVQKQYEAGTINITPILDAEEYATTAKLSSEQDRFTIMRYKLALSYALNKLDEPYRH